MPINLIPTPNPVMAAGDHACRGYFRAVQPDRESSLVATSGNHHLNVTTT